MEDESMDKPLPPADQRAAHDAHVSPNSRLGLVLFVIYLALYLGFMGIAAFKHELFASTPFGGVNLAVLYGMVLIVSALVLALIYMKLCKTEQ
jgi:uncharacterized membrane protein (DUF485 family)